METRQIGPLSVSLVGLGCNQVGLKVDLPGTRELVAAALEAGITMFDTADSYAGGESERLLGSALAGKRNEAIIATKFGSKVGETAGGARPEYLRVAVEQSLGRLQTDWIDLYQLHRPDPTVPIEETLGALGELVTAGKVRAIGHSNFSPPQIDAAAAVDASTQFASAQNEWSLVERSAENGVVPAAERNGLAIIPYYPLASGVLTGKYLQGETIDSSWRLAPADARRRGQRLNPEVLSTVEKLKSYATDRQYTTLELAFSWLASHPAVGSIIAGATNPDQVTSNATAPRWKLTTEELADVDALTAHRLSADTRAEGKNPAGRAAATGS